MLFKDAIEKFSDWRQIKFKKNTVRGYEYDLKQFCLYMRNPHIEEVRLEDVVGFLKFMLELGWKQNALIPKSMAFRKFFEFFLLQRYNVLDFRLIPIPKREYFLPRTASEEEYGKLLKAIPRHTKDCRHIRNFALITMLWDTGARIGELLSLNISDIDIWKKKALIRTEKAQSAISPFREIFWTAETNECLTRWIKKREDEIRKFKFEDPEALFVGNHCYNVGRRITNEAVGVLLRKYCRKAGIRTLNPHSFRHHFGIDLAEKEAGDSVISSMLGHSSLKSSFIYTRLTGRALEGKYRKYKGA